MIARNPERGERARERVAAVAGGEVRLAICDLSDLTAVRALAGELRASVPRLDVLVNNAGVLVHEPLRSVDGIELTLATNVVGPHLLVRELVGVLGAGARVVTVASGGMYTQKLDLTVLSAPPGSLGGETLYAQTKRMEVILTQLWAARLRDAGVGVYAMHPGWVDTAGLRASLPGFYGLWRRLLRTPAQGADTIVWLGAVDGLRPNVSGSFWLDRARRPTHYLPWTRESEGDRERLWAQVERLAGEAA